MNPFIPEENENEFSNISNISNTTNITESNVVNANNKKKQMLPLPLNIEKYGLQIGIDEAGRGALAFDVFTAAVVLPSEIIDNLQKPEDMKLLTMIKDSKKMSAKQRERCANFIEQFALYYGIASANVKEIDEHNILKATMIAMHRSIDIVIQKIRDDKKDSERFIRLMVDGDRFTPYYDNEKQKIIPFTCIPNGDAQHMNIAAASILAKVYRDKHVTDICHRCPDLDEKYGFLSNKAYGTKKHMNGLKHYGITHYHRQSFAPVKKCS